MRNIEELIEQHRAWWKLENEKAIININYGGNLAWSWQHSDTVNGLNLILKDGSIAEDGPLTPDMLSTSNMHQIPLTNGDMFRTVNAFGKIPWMEAICGVTPRISVKAYSIWGGYGSGIWPDDWWAKDIKVEVQKDWLELLVETTKYLVERFWGPFVVTQTSVMRGPIDVMAALIGDKNVVVAIYRHPKEFHKLMDRLSDIMIMVMKAQNEHLPRFKGGMVNTFGIWAPGTVTRHQEDEAAYLSPKQYREFVMPYDIKICKEFDYTAMHVHAAHWMHGDSITDIAELGALQQSLEPPPYGPTLKEWMPMLKRRIKKKPLILNGPLSRAQITMLREELGEAGLYLSVRVTEAGEGSYIYKE